ncbi:phosphatase [Adhaeribacter aquaticus]|uniref:Ppx/GppA phosphatase family protein n=1 Tax=Adhaeribacter aquaticus TaxID=299567 RepID=UPI0003F6FEC0|nr:phosphatase [Adhaeribacter aquaticus]
MENKKKLALIDLGTNTFHLLIVEVDQDNQVETLVKIKEPVKLGEGGISHGAITDAARERALKTLKSFKALVDEHQVNVVRALATSAMRNTANGPELVQAIAEETGFVVEIISGDKEAELIYYGVKSALDLGTEKNLIVDIGGGSVEFIIADNQQIYWKESYEIGAQRLLDKFFVTDPISEIAIEAEKHFLQEQLSSLTKAVEEFKPTVLIGSSGTFDTLCDIDAQKNGIDRQQDCCPESDLSLGCFYEIYEDIIRKNKAERLAIPGMLEMRVDMIVVASVLIDYILENNDLHKIRVSSYALKEGMLNQILSQA